MHKLTLVDEFDFVLGGFEVENVGEIIGDCMRQKVSSANPILISSLEEVVVSTKQWKCWARAKGQRQAISAGSEMLPHKCKN